MLYPLSYGSKNRLSEGNVSMRGAGGVNCCPLHFFYPQWSFI